jgi:methionyl-tRNA formyltransferase
MSRMDATNSSAKAPPREVVFFGAGAFGIPSLSHLVSTRGVQAVVTQPDRPAGRGGSLTPTPIAQWCAEHAPSLPVLKPERASAAESSAAIRAYSAREWVVIAFGQKLSKALLSDRFAINLHASILPRWRGAAPIHAALLAGDPEIGNSVITLADRMDAGEVLLQSRHPADQTKTCGEWHDRLAIEGTVLIDHVLEAHAAGTLSPHPQRESDVTIAKKLSRADAWIDFAATAEECRRRIHALTPWPGVGITIAGHDLKLLRVEPDRVDREHDYAPGMLLDADLGVLRCAGDSALRILELQPAGRKPMDWPSFARGARFSRGVMAQSKVSVPTSQRDLS